MSRESHVRSIHYRRRNATKQRVRKALKAMKEEDVPITFRSVSRVSGVSPGALYYHKDIKEEIEHAREERRSLAPRRAALEGLGTAAEMHREVVALRKRIAELEEEVRLSELLIDIDHAFDLYEDLDMV